MINVAVGRLHMTVEIEDHPKQQVDAPDVERHYRNEMARVEADRQRREWEARTGLMGRLR